MLTKTFFITYCVSLFAVTNSIGNLAVFLGLTADRNVHQQHRIAITAAIAILIILLLSTWIGSEILRIFGINMAAFELAGGLVIIFIGLNMLQAKKSRTSHSEEEHAEAKGKESIAVVPLALPIIAGPGAITTAIIAAQRFPFIKDKLILSCADLIITLAITIVLLFAPLIKKLLGMSGIKILSRIMGLILIAIAFDMIIAGAKAAFPGWG